MAGTDLTLAPAAVALHTRDREDDYHWRYEVGQLSMSDELKEMYRELVADRSAHPATSLILLDRGSRLGLVVANLKSERRDHAHTRINDTVLAEFPPDQRRQLLLAVAGLLDPNTADCRTRFLDYAEHWFEVGSGQATAGEIRMPVGPAEVAQEDQFDDRHVAVRSNELNLRRVAGLLRSAASGIYPLERPFLLVSTGFVGLETLERFTSRDGQFIALSRSGSLPEGGDVPLKKKLPRRSRKIPLVVIAGIGLIGLTNLFIYLDISSTNSAESLPNAPAPHGRRGVANEARNVAAAVGLAGICDSWATLTAVLVVLSDAPVGTEATPNPGSK